MKIEEKYSLIIPTFNRPGLFERLISYLSFKHAGFRIYVLDSSDEEIKKNNKLICSASGLDIDYYDYPSDLSVIDKFLDGLKIIKTEYVSFCADDDFIIPDVIENCLEFLDNNADYVGCHGHYIELWQKSEKSYRLFLQYSAPSIDGDSWAKRFFQLMQPYESIVYAVFRTAVLKNAFEVLSHSDFKRHNLFIELFLGLAPLVAGKIGRLNLLYYIRGEEGFSSPKHKSNPPLCFADSPETMIAEYNSYSKTLSDYIADYSQDSETDKKYEKIIDIAHSLYFFDSKWQVGRYFSDKVKLEWELFARCTGNDHRLLPYYRRGRFPFAQRIKDSTIGFLQRSKYVQLRKRILIPVKIKGFLFAISYLIINKITINNLKKDLADICEALPEGRPGKIMHQKPFLVKTLKFH